MKHTMILVVAIVLGTAAIFAVVNTTLFSPKQVGDKIDELNGVAVYYNGPVSNVSSRSLSTTGYNIGLKYQCVEFVKRYYLEYLDHEMPNSYGHAKDFYNKKLSDGTQNSERDLMQFSNRSATAPKVNDILVFDSNVLNSFGHVAIISKVTAEEIEFTQQNGGPYADTRVNLSLENSSGKYVIDGNRVLGWLGKR